MMDDDVPRTETFTRFLHTTFGSKSRFRTRGARPLCLDIWGRGTTNPSNGWQKGGNFLNETVDENNALKQDRADHASPIFWSSIQKSTRATQRRHFATGREERDRMVLVIADSHSHNRLSRTPGRKQSIRKTHTTIQTLEPYLFGSTQLDKTASRHHLSKGIQHSNNIATI